MRKALFVCGLVLIVAATAQAQTKFSGKMQCAKADPNYMAPVGDRSNHVLSLAKVKCTWTQGELAGAQLKDEDDTMFGDVSGNTSRDRGYGVGTSAAGDKYFVRFDGTTMLKDNAPVSGKCSWSFTAGGSGKWKGITGKGTCAGTFKPDGTSTWDVEGEYQIPAPAATKGKK